MTATRDSAISITASDSCSLKSNFSAMVLQNRLQLVNLALPASSSLQYNWNFRDGSVVSTDFSPTHDFLQTGTYNVCLAATRDAACSSKLCGAVVISSIDKHDLKITPNPVTGLFVVKYNSALDEKITISIIDNRGHLVSMILKQAVTGINSYALSSGDLKPGWYVVYVTGNAGNKTSARFLKL